MVAELMTRLRRSGAPQCSAFTLIEMVVVIGIMALMVGIAIPVVGASLRATEASETKNTMKALAEGIENFYQDTDIFPTVLEELVTTKKKVTGWSGPYVNEGFSGSKDNIYYDAWQNLFQYQATTSTATVRSWGPNRKEEKGGGDDIDFVVDVTSLLRSKNQKLLDEVNAAIQAYNSTLRTTSLPVLEDTGKIKKSKSGIWHTHHHIYKGKWTAITHRHKLKDVHSIKDLYDKKKEKDVADEPSVLDIPLLSPWSYTLVLLELRSLLDNHDKRYDKDAWGNAFITGPDPVQYVTSKDQN
ncbi:MAG: type II secretion system protein GspG [Planctomycetes bacterium]|nr:type II secretion system protein GspG [Planctomycetota bacterium]